MPDPRASTYCRPTGPTAMSAPAFFFQAEDGIRDVAVTGVQTCALPIFQPTGVGADEGLGITADAIDGGGRLLQMLDRTIDAFLPGNGQDVAVSGARTGRTGASRHDHARPDFLGAESVHLDVMHAAVHAVDDEPNPIAHL